MPLYAFYLLAGIKALTFTAYKRIFLTNSASIMPIVGSSFLPFALHIFLLLLPVSVQSAKPSSQRKVVINNIPV
jgi:hypothetical protein